MRFSCMVRNKEAAAKGCAGAGRGMATRKTPDDEALGALADELAADAKDNQLEVAIGRQVRQSRQQLDMTVAEGTKHGAPPRRDPGG